jgi:hypothetical protein
MNYSDREIGHTQSEVDDLLANLDFSKHKTAEEEAAELRAILDLIGAPADDVMKPAIVDLDSAGPTGPTGPMVEETNQVGKTQDEGAESVIPGSETSAMTTSILSTSTQPDAPHAVMLKPSMPDGYAQFSDGIYEMPADETAAPIFICTPLRVDATFTDQQSLGWGRLISVKSANGSWHEIPVTNANLFQRPRDVIATLVDHGLELGTDNKAMERLLRLLKIWKPVEHLQSVNRMGWVDDSHTAFVLGSTLIGREDLLALAPPTGIGTGLVTSGDVKSWKQEVGAKNRKQLLPGRLSSFVRLTMAFIIRRRLTVAQLLFDRRDQRRHRNTESNADGTDCAQGRLPAASFQKRDEPGRNIRPRSQVLLRHSQPFALFAQGLRKGGDEVFVAAVHGPSHLAELDIRPRTVVLVAVQPPPKLFRTKH